MNEHGEDIAAQVAAQLIKDSLTSIYEPLSKFIIVKKLNILRGLARIAFKLLPGAV